MISLLTIDTVDIWVLGILASTMAGLATASGALLVLIKIKLNDAIIATSMGFGAGVMLAASSFSLIVPAYEMMTGHWLQKGLLISAGLFVGALFIFIAELLLPHEHFYKGKEGPSSLSIKRSWLFVIAIAIHNFPEGLAVGVSFGGENIDNAYAITTGIALQNFPEGLVAALALISVGYSRLFSFGIAAMTGLIEFSGGLIGLAATHGIGLYVPFFLAFSAGAMIYVVSHEVIPESHRSGFEKYASWGLMFGFALMMTLDKIFE